MAYVWCESEISNVDYIASYIPDGGYENVVAAWHVDRDDYPEFGSVYHGYVIKCRDGSYWTDIEKSGSVRMFKIEAENLEEAKATALMLWRMEA
jgi:hypothetical protein